MNPIHRSTAFAATLLMFTITGVRTGNANGPEPTSYVPAGYTGKPLTGTPQVIPGTIQAESYDVAAGDAKGVTVGYTGELHKTDLRPGADSVGLARYGNGHVSIDGRPEAPDQVYVGWTDPGEWLAYTVQIKETGTYILGGKFAAGGKGSKLSVAFTPELAIGPVEIPTTAGYQPGVEVYHVWEKLDRLGEITLPAGIYVMKVKIETDAGLNMDYYTFARKP